MNAHKVGCSKTQFPHRNIKKKKKKTKQNCQNKLCQKSRKQSNIYRSQGNTKSRKRQLKNNRKVCGIFIGHNPHSPHGLGGNL